MFKAGFGGAQVELAGYLAEGRARAGFHHQRPRRATADAGAEEDGVGAFGEATGGGHHARVLFGGIGFAGEDGLVDEAIARLKDEAVGWNE